MTDTDWELTALLDVADDPDPAWRRTVAGLRAYSGLRAGDKIARCGGCRAWVIHPEDHGGRAVSSVPRPWVRKQPGCQPTCRACVAREERAAAERAADAVAVPAGYTV